jgi:GNAT superfamily N-acetyltransferase
VRAVEAAARERGVERLTADVWAFNDEACGFFDRFGLAPYMLRYWR